MAVGDLVNGIAAAAGIAYFQPAATVEIIILSVTGRTVVYAGLYDGVNSSSSRISNGGSVLDSLNSKLGIKFPETKTIRLPEPANLKILATISGYSMRRFKLQ